MQVATHNGVKVYNLSSGKTLPMWLSERKRRALTKDEDYRRRIELIQDFEFSTSCHRVKVCPDGEHIIATGTYPPTLRAFTVSDLSMKFERRLTCEIVDFEILADDFSKLAILQADRMLAFHAAYGSHYALRIPKFGRTLAYQPQTCNIYVGASGNELYELNLDLGVFKSPISLRYEGCNSVKINPVHGLIAAGGDSTIVQLFDSRTDSDAALLNIESAVLSTSSVNVSTLQFDTDGLTMAVGTNTGHVLLYDLRSSRPLYVKEHQYGLPIVNVTFHNGAKKVLSADKKVVKIWEREGEDVGAILTNIETPADINDVCVVEDKRGQSGLMFIGGEQRRVMSYFVPQLGPAPRWCAFLESLTEELEEQKNQSVYDDYKFITRQEVEELGVSNLVGTPLLKGYMHGFFIDMALYSKLRAVANPFEYEEWKRNKIKEKIEEKRKSRISKQKRLPKVNAQLAERMLKTKGASDDTGLSQNPTGDDRFGRLFTSSDFEVNPESDEYKMRHPSQQQKPREVDSDDEAAGVDPLQHDFERVESSDDNDYDQLDDDDDDEASDLDEPRYIDSDEERQKAQTKKRPRGGAAGGTGGKHQRSRARDNDDGEILALSKRIAQRKQERQSQAQSQQQQQQQRKRRPNFFEISDAGGNALFVHTSEARKALKSTQQQRAEVLADRVKKSQRKEEDAGTLRTIRSDQGFVREFSFVPKGRSSNKTKQKSKR